MPVGDGLIRQVYRQHVAFFFFGAQEEFLDLLLAQRRRQDSVLEAIVVENVRIAWRDDHAEAVVFYAPRRVLAARSAAEIMPRQQDRCAFVAWKIQHKFRIRFLAWQVAPVIEQNPAKSLPRQRLQELLWHHLVGVHIDPVQRRDHPSVGVKRFHSIRAPQKLRSLFPKSSSLYRGHIQRTYIHKMAGDGCGRRHHWADEVRPAVLALAALKIAVGGAGAALVWREDIGVHADAHTAACVPPLETRLAE